MKIKFLIIGCLALMSANVVFAQKGELSNAKDEYDKYVTYRGQKVKLIMDQATASLNNAKTSIDKAAANEKTANLPLTWAVKGGVYTALAYRDTVPSTSTPLFATAEEALKKARELDKTGENKKIIDDAYLYLGNIKYQIGVKAFNSKKFDAAYQALDYYRSLNPEDTTAIYLAGFSAINANKTDEAISNFNKLLTKNYSKNPAVYNDLSSIYLNKKDTANAIKTLNDGIAKYPNNQDLAKKEIELNLRTGKNQEVIEKVEKAIAANPGNKTLYYYAGLAYSSTKDYTKAEAMYRKAVEIDPNYPEATLNLGGILMKPGLAYFNTANSIPPSKQKEYDAAMAKAYTLLDAAKPVVEKAVELNPKSAVALSNLKTYYLAKKDLPNANAIQKRIDAL